jgi:ATP-dependent DNA ligase
MHARLDRGAVRLLTRTGLDWTHKYPAIADAVASIGARQAYLDGELCGVRPDGITSFSMIQAASDSGNAAALVFFLFDLLHLNGEDLCSRRLIERKERLAALLSNAGSPLHYCDHQVGHGREFHEKACALSLEGSSRSTPMRLMRPATAACGSRSNACTARNLSWSAGPIPKGPSPGSGRCCSPITTLTAG